MCYDRFLGKDLDHAPKKVKCHCNSKYSFVQCSIIHITLSIVTSYSSCFVVDKQIKHTYSTAKIHCNGFIVKTIQYTFNSYKLTNTTCPLTDFGFTGMNFFKTAHKIPGTNSKENTVIWRTNFNGSTGKLLDAMTYVT